jgi:uncharacterized protein
LIKIPAIFRALLLAVLSLCLCFSLSQTAQAEPKIPELSRHVMDQAGMLAPASGAQLEARLAAYEKTTGHQFVLFTVPSLEGANLEQYSMSVAEKWKLGDKDRDDGIILLIVQKEKQARIEVGYGLEGAVPDAKAAQVIRHQLIPAFKQGNFEAGITSSLDVLMKLAAGESVKLGEENTEKERSGGLSLLPLLFWFVIIILIIKSGGSGGRGFLAGALLGNMMGRRGGGFGGGGGGFGGGGGGGFGGGGASGGW